MRKIALMAMAVSLGACSAALDGSGAPPAPRALQAARPSTPARRPAPDGALAPVGVVVSSPSDDRSTSILAYHADLEACRSVALAGLRSPAALDDVAALKRSLADHAASSLAGGPAGNTADRPDQGVVSVSHRSDDLALRRDRAVRTCLSKRGYVLKD